MWRVVRKCLRRRRSGQLQSQPQSFEVYGFTPKSAAAMSSCLMARSASPNLLLAMTVEMATARATATIAV